MSTSILDLAPEERDDRLRTDTHDDTAALKPLVSASHQTQESVHEFLKRFERLPKSMPLPPKSLGRVHDSTSAYIELQERLLDLAMRYEPLAHPDAEERAAQGIDAGLRVKAILVSLAAALTLYDNYLTMRRVVEDGRLRRIINSADRGYGMAKDELRDFFDRLNSPEARSRVRLLIDWYEHIADGLDTSGDPDLAFLKMTIDASAARRAATSGQQALPSEATRRREWFLDELESFGDAAVSKISEIFGNGIGMVETRKGKLWRNAETRKALLDTLEPLDLLLEKTPFRLTDQFIPGHFGHVAVWVGSYDELDALGVWNNPVFEEEHFRACREMVRDGHQIVEALRSGVQLSTLDAFMNVDDLAVLRPKHVTGAQRTDALIRAFRQVGKEYDFNFEVETTDRITCSELAYHVYPWVPWETEDQLGYHTINPDQVAKEASGDHPWFRLLAFYHDGARVDPDKALALMERLMTED